MLTDEFNSTYSISGVYGLLTRLNFTKIKPRPKHEKNNKTLMQQWKETTLPIVVENTRCVFPGKEIEIWFQDEMRFGEKTQTSGQWKLCGTSYTQTKQLGYRNQYIFGAVNPKNGSHIGFVTDGISTDAMNIHLDLVSKGIREEAHAILIMDQAGWHAKSKELVVPKNITILNLPPYSPELNPIERLWKWLKSRYLTNRFISKNDDLTDIACEVWNKITESAVKSVCHASFTNFL